MIRIDRLAADLLVGRELTRAEAVEILTDDALSPLALFEQANRVREAVFGNKVHLCSIVNAKMGGCPEDCGFCSQSARFQTGIERTDIIGENEAARAAARAAKWGSGGLGLVTATRGFKVGAEFDKILADVRRISRDGHLEAHASLGLLGPEEFRLLREAGCTEFNHNLETGRRYFEKVCTTHTYDDRINTIRNAKAVGMRTCVGGIIGMGEGPEDRVDLALTLKELDVDEVPLNFLVSVEGTPMATVATQHRAQSRLGGADDAQDRVGRVGSTAAAGAALPPLELLRQISVFRFILPRKNIFICAGRHHLGDLQWLIFFAGASGIMIGDFLTTANRKPEDDLKMISDLGLEPRTCGTAKPTRQRARAGASLPVV